MRFTEREEAVSPVIGVILMVAITVILAAVIAVFVFGLAGDLESGAQKDARITTGVNNAGLVTFTVFSGSDVPKITKIEWTNGSTLSTGSIGDGTAGSVSVGNFTVTKNPKDGEKVVFTAFFSDGASQVVGQSS